MSFPGRVGQPGAPLADDGGWAEEDAQPVAPSRRAIELPALTSSAGEESAGQWLQLTTGASGAEFDFFVPPDAVSAVRQNLRLTATAL